MPLFIPLAGMGWAVSDRPRNAIRRAWLQPVGI